jgi:hypothetical protein
VVVAAVGCGGGDGADAGRTSDTSAASTTVPGGRASAGAATDPGAVSDPSTTPDGPGAFGGITTTTVYEVVTPGCDPTILGLATLAVINPVYSTVDSYGCDPTHAWVWMSRGDSAPDGLLSVLLVSTGGVWQAMDTVAVCAAGDRSGVAADVLADGCAHL